MKTSTKKLSLSKITISNLDHSQMSMVYGGITGFCLTQKSGCIVTGCNPKPTLNCSIK
jgi:natural product precursor